MTPKEVLFFAVLAFVFPVALGIYRRREGIRYRLRRVILGELAYFIVVVLFLKAGQSPLTAILAGLVCALLVDRFTPARSRHIKRSERRKAVARWELKTGRKFNSRLHHVDHIVPFAKGGSSTADNLQVLERRENLAKGKKSPWWDLLGR